MELQQKIRADMQNALKNRETLKLSVLRGLITAITNDLVAKGQGPGGNLSDDEVLSLIKREVKKRREAIEQFEAGGRKDLSDKEKEEIVILEPYLPQMAGKDEIQKVVLEKIAKLGIETSDTSQKGILIGKVMKEMGGKADGVLVKEVVEEAFK